MSEIEAKLDFSTFKLAVVISAILTFMKIAGWIDISIWIILLPIFICIGVWFFIVFLIGLCVLYMFVKHITEKADESEESQNET